MRRYLILSGLYSQEHMMKFARFFSRMEYLSYILWPLDVSIIQIFAAHGPTARVIKAMCDFWAV